MSLQVRLPVWETLYPTVWFRQLAAKNMEYNRISKLSVPLAIGLIVIAAGILALSEIIVIGLFLSIPSILVGLGIGLLTVPILRETGIGYFPQQYHEILTDGNQGSTLFNMHIIYSIFYSYLSSLLGFAVGVGDSPWANYSPLQIGIITGLIIGLLFFIGHLIDAQRFKYKISVKFIFISAFYGVLLCISGSSWWLLVGVPDF